MKKSRYSEEQIATALIRQRRQDTQGLDTPS